MCLQYLEIDQILCIQRMINYYRIIVYSIIVYRVIVFRISNSLHLSHIFTLSNISRTLHILISVLRTLNICGVTGLRIFMWDSSSLWVLDTLNELISVRYIQGHICFLILIGGDTR